MWCGDIPMSLGHKKLSCNIPLSSKKNKWFVILQYLGISKQYFTLMYNILGECQGSGTHFQGHGEVVLGVAMCTDGSCICDSDHHPWCR